MTIIAGKPTKLEEEADRFAGNFVEEMKRIENAPDELLYHWHKGAHRTPAGHHSPYWQPVDDQS